MLSAYRILYEMLLALYHNPTIKISTMLKQILNSGKRNSFECKMALFAGDPLAQRQDKNRIKLHLSLFFSRYRWIFRSRN